MIIRIMSMTIHKRCIVLIQELTWAEVLPYVKKIEYAASKSPHPPPPPRRTQV